MRNLYNYKHNPIVKRILLTMLAPTILMNLTTAIGSMADTVIIGHYLDDLSLSVVTFAMPIFMIINTFAALFAVGGCIAMSIDSGRGAKENANRAFSISVELLTAIGLILLIAGAFFTNTITRWLGASTEVFESTRQYVQIILLGAPIFTLNIGLAFFVRNDGRPTLSMAGMFSSIVVDIILNFIFVGCLGKGIPGAAYSTIIGQAVGIIVVSTHFLSRKNTLKFRFAFDKSAWRIIKNGTSSALHFVYQFLCILIINHLLAKLAGASGVVVYTVVFNLATVSLSVFEGISQTIQPMISNYYGEKSYKNIRETMRLAFIAVIIICGTVTALLEIFPKAVPTVFGLDDIELIGKSAMAVRIFATSMIVTTVNVVIGYYLQSTERNVISAIFVSLRCFILFLGATFILGKNFGMNGIWAAYTVAEVLSLAIILIVTKLMQKKLGDSNFLLLYRPTEEGISCYTFDFGKDDYSEYTAEIERALNGIPELSESAVKGTVEYLNVLKECLVIKKRNYIEVEINKTENKIIIRDNLNHVNITEKLQASVQHAETSDYGPVLGWNRMCIG